MKRAFAAYCEHFAKLSQIANKQTLFLSQMLMRMRHDKETKQNIVSLTRGEKIRIMREISKESNPDKLADSANAAIRRLKAVGIIHAMKNTGDYIIDPECYGTTNPVPPYLRMKAKAIYSCYIFTDNHVSIENGVLSCDGRKVNINDLKGVETDASGKDYIVADDGERIDLE